MKKLLLISLLLIAVNLQAQQPPTACFTGDSVGSPPCTINFTDLSLGNPTSWGWLFTGGSPPSTMVQNPAGITWITPGTYTVELTVSNAFGFDIETKVGVVTYTANTCSFDTTIGTPCTLTTGLDDLARVDEAISIYPNPTSGKFTVSGAAEIQVYDLFGRLLLHSNEAQIDMSSYPAGLYIWSVGSARGKLIKE